MKIDKIIRLFKIRINSLGSQKRQIKKKKVKKKRQKEKKR